MALKPELIRRIIFDLDDTLFDTHGQLVDAAVIESFQAMIKGGLNANLNECLTQRREFLSIDSRKDIFLQIANHFGVRKEKQTEPIDLSKIGFDSFHNREIKEKIFLFPEAQEMLEELQQIYDLYLVTMGAPRTQRKKVELLNLTPLFSEIIYVNVSTEKDKTAAFKRILELPPQVAPDSVLSIGNRIDSEIRDAKTLGMQTVLLLHGEYTSLKAQSPVEEPDERVDKISGLLDLL